ncbi:MAG TPA: glycoside hydrolase family 88 protein [Candidatus Caccovicinus merdipullorum]|uniref:Glycoside hydrolase family 88 protein n=1 Tax=Candidatus Caccovicinus merdipullorum TaxID=2840724 RepID=A0A9D1GKP8_9FIRM|nr:glycoside hydrolase family 88 protein [Candidatus Caccovicinus merdipullorum]
MDILDRYIDQLLEKSTPQAPVWNLEKIRAGKKPSWNYMDGCMIKAIIELYHITKNEKYLQFADDFIDYFVNDDGSIQSYDPKEYNLDNVNAGKTLFDLYQLTGKEKYRKAIDTVYSQLQGQPRTSTGNFWHKMIYPNQIWLDGLYMAQPFYMQYEVTYNDCKNCADSFNQFENVYNLMRDTRNGLYYHAYDDSRQMFWCDKVTGLSSNFWLRALGWYAMALIDTMEIMPESLSKEKARLNAIYKELIDSMLPYQDEETGMWYQVVNRGGIKPNYLETSGSAIFAYAIMKSVRLGFLDESYFQYGEKAFSGICRTYLSEENGELQLGGICLVAGLGNKEMREGTFDYYMREPIVKNEAKGVAPLILAYIEIMFHNGK